MGLNDERRDGDGRGVPGVSPRRDVVEDFLPNAGEDERLRLATLGLRRTATELEGRRVGKPGDEGMRCRSDRALGELGPGDCGSDEITAAVWLWEFAWRERRFNEWDRRLASLFVDCRGAAFGAPSLGGGVAEGGRCGLCILSDSVAAPCVCAVCGCRGVFVAHMVKGKSRYDGVMLVAQWS